MFLATQRGCLEVEWASVQNTGERPFKRGEAVDVFIRRANRWAAPVVVQVPQPAVVSRPNADGSVDVQYTCVLPFVCLFVLSPGRYLVCLLSARVPVWQHWCL